MSEIVVAQKKQRIAWIDIAKGIAILTVIWSHSLPYGSLPRNLIFCFHMPLFFIVSGFTLKPANSIKDLIVCTKKDFVRLIVPVIFVTTVSSILAVLLNGASLSAEIRNTFYKLFWANGVPFADGLPSLGMPWFLVALFISKLLLRILSLLFKKDFELVAILCGLVGMMLGLKYIWLPFNFDMALVCMIFVAGGMLAHRHIATLSKYCVPIFIASALFIYYMLMRGRYIEFAGHSYDLGTVIEGFAASFIVCIICNSASSIRLVHKIFCFIGVNTMPIFLTHHLDEYYSFLFKNDDKYLECILRTFYTLLFAWAFTYIFRLITKIIRYISAYRKA